MSQKKRYHFSYQEMCQNMAFDLKIKLLEKDDILYEIIDGIEHEVCNPTNQKTLWFEAWLILRERIKDSDFRFKNYSWT